MWMDPSRWICLQLWILNRQGFQKERERLLQLLSLAIKQTRGGRQLFSFRFGRLTHFLSCAYLCAAWVWSDGGRLRDSCFAPERPVPHTGSPRGQELAGSVYWMCAWMSERGVKELLVHKRLARSKEQWIVSDCIIWISLSHVSGRQLVKIEIPRQILEGLSWNFVRTFTVLRRWILLTLTIPWLSLLGHRRVDFFVLRVTSQQWWRDVNVPSKISCDKFGNSLTPIITSTKAVICSPTFFCWLVCWQDYTKMT